MESEKVKEIKDSKQQFNSVATLLEINTKE